MKTGRPSDYNPDCLETAKAYLKTCETKVVMPQMAQLAYQLGCARSSLYVWAKEHEEFSDILERLMALQEFTLISNGLNSNYNSTITKLILTKHGYNDKVETDITSKGERLFNSVKELSDGELEHIVGGSQTGTSETGTSETQV